MKTEKYYLDTPCIDLQEEGLIMREYTFHKLILQTDDQLWNSGRFPTLPISHQKILYPNKRICC